MLSRGATWREAGLSIKRVHKDKRARKHFLGFLLLISIPALVGTYVVWLAGTGALFFLPLVLPVIWWRNRRAKQEAVPLSIMPSPAPVSRVLTDAERQALRSYFADLALFFAVIVQRSASEGFLKTKVLPEGMEVVSRRTHLDRLRSRGIWDRLPSGDREALMMADGHWDWNAINHASTAIEPLRLLRWILRIDFYLPVVGQQLSFDQKMASSLIDAPDSLFAGNDLIGAEAVERGKEAAAHFFIRCYAEGVARKYYQPGNEQEAEWAGSVSAALSGKQHEDLVLGDRLVGEAPEQDLRWATMLAQQRRDFLGWILSILENGAVPDFYPKIFAQQAEPDPVETV